MKMNRIVLLIGAVLVGCMCSNARAGDVGLRPDQIFIWNSYQNIDIDRFDISREISALKQAKAERDNAVKNSDGDEKKITEAMQKFEKVKKQKLDGIKNRRRDIYMKGFSVTRHAYAWSRRGEHYTNHFVLYNPNPSEWVMINDSCHWVTYTNTGGSIYNPHFTSNEYIVDIKFDWGIIKLRQLGFTLVGRFRYKDAIIEKMLKNDMIILRARIESAL